MKGIMKVMLAREAEAPGTVLDRTFIRAHTSGFEELCAALDDVGWDEIVDSSGLSRAEVEQAARVMIEANRTIVCWAMGITQHKNGVANVQEILNVLLLRGNIGRPGAGACPVRGHSNVQGDRTMGTWERMPDAFLDRLGAEMCVVSASRGALPPASPMLRSEVWIVCELAARTLGATSGVDFRYLAGDYARIRAHVAGVVPGFEDFEARVRVPGGFYLGNAARDRVFATRQRRRPERHADVEVGRRHRRSGALRGQRLLGRADRPREPALRAAASGNLARRLAPRDPRTADGRRRRRRAPEPATGRMCTGATRPW